MAERIDQPANAHRPPVDLTERQRAVLRAVVEDYVLTAVPVGSQALVRRYGLDVSPATIRSAMADLEDLGLLTHPHTSAGRVPSDLGLPLLRRSAHARVGAGPRRCADDPAPVQPGAAHQQRLAAAGRFDPRRLDARGRGRDSRPFPPREVRPPPARRSRRSRPDGSRRPDRWDRHPTPPRPVRGHPCRRPAGDARTISTERPRS